MLKASFVFMFWSFSFPIWLLAINDLAAIGDSDTVSYKKF